MSPLNVDHVLVERFLAGEHDLAKTANADERQAVLDAWLASGRTVNQLVKATGWNVTRMLRNHAA